MAHVRGLHGPRGPWFVLSRQHGPRPPLFQGCAHGLDLSPGVIHHVHRLLLTSVYSICCASEVRRDWPLSPEYSRTTGSFKLLCPIRGMLSAAAIGQIELLSWEGPRGFGGEPSIGKYLFRVSDVENRGTGRKCAR